MVDSVETVLRDGHRERGELLVLLGERAVGEHLLADLAERAIDLHRRLQHQAVEALLLRVALVDMHESPPVMMPSSGWVGAPRWPSHPPTLGSARETRDAPRSCSRLRQPGGGPEMAPTPPTLGSAPGNPGRSSVMLTPSSAQHRARRPSPAARR